MALRSAGLVPREDRYLTEFTFRVNHREMQNAMFDLLIGVV
jgi:hypothetical protein